MIDFEVLEEEWIGKAEAKKILKDIKGREATPEQKLAIEYLNKTKSLSTKDSTELRKELGELNMRKLKEELIAQIVDLVPRTAEEIKVIISGSKISFSKKDLDAILKVVSKYVK